MGLSASEAVYGVLAWLTCRDEVLELSCRHDCAPAAEASRTFCEANNLKDPRDDWHKNLIHPKNKE